MTFRQATMEQTAANFVGRLNINRLVPEALTTVDLAEDIESLADLVKRLAHEIDRRPAADGQP